MEYHGESSPTNDPLTMSVSSQYRSIQPDEMNMRDNLLAPARNNFTLARPIHETSGPINTNCIRNIKPSKRNKIIMTRSVDLQDQKRSHLTNQNGGTNTVTARMQLNKNTTLELIDAQHQPALKGPNPFQVKTQRQRYVEERGNAIQN